MVNRVIHQIVLAWIVLLQLSASSCSVINLPVLKSDVKNHLATYLDEKVNEFKTELHRSFEMHRHRQRRNVQQATVREWFLSDILESSPLHFDGSTVEHFTFGGKDYLIVGDVPQATMGDIHSMVYVYNTTSEAFEDTGIFLDIQGVADIEVVHLDGSTYVAVAKNHNAANRHDIISTIYKFDTSSSPEFTVFQEMYTNGATDFEITVFNQETYLFVANSRTDFYARHRNKLEVFHWSGAYFDRVAKTWLYSAQDICTFEIDGELFIAVTQYTDNDGNLDIGTKVFKFDDMMYELIELQTLKSTAPKDIEYFEANEHHYLVIANAFGTDESHSIIYWWAGSGFVEYQRIATFNATAIESIRMPNGEVIIAIANSEDVGTVFYNVDQSGMFVPSTVQGLGTNFSNPEFTDLQEFTIGNSFYLAVSTMGVFELVFDSQVVLPSPKPILTCLADVIANLTAQMMAVAQLQERLNNRLSLSMEQTVDVPVVFNVSVTSQKNFTTEDLVLDNDNRFDLDDSLEPVNRRDVKKNLTDILNDLDEYTKESKQVVMVSKVQDIGGRKTFNESVEVVDTLNVADLYIENGLISGVDVVKINNTAVWRNADQTITGNTTFYNNVSINSNITLYGLLNNVDFPGNVLLNHGDQNITGNITFESDVNFESKITIYNLNGINLSSELVTTFGEQVIHGNKTIESDITVSGNVLLPNGTSINGVDPSEFVKTAVSLAEDGQINGKINFFRDLDIQNDLLVTGLINNVDIGDLAAEVIYKHKEYQTVTARKDFLNNVYVKNDITGNGTINGIDISEDLVYLNTDQDILGKVTISGDGNFTSITCDLVNGVDLSLEAILVSGAQTMSGAKSFKNGFTVSGDIIMSPLATVDQVDIDVFNSTVMKLTEPASLEGIKTFKNNVTVNGSVVLSDILNGLNISFAMDDVLTKSTDQIINVPVDLIGDFVFMGNLNTSRFDNLHMDDFILLEAPGQIEGFKNFTDHVNIVGDLDVDSEVKINGIDLSALDNSVVKKEGNQTILGNIEFSDSISVDESIEAFSVNGFDILQDLVRLDDQQTVAGQKTLRSNPVFIMGNLNVTETYVDTINDVNITLLNQEAVLVDGSHIIEGSKVFIGTLEVTGFLDVNGLVDGVNTTEFTENVVMLSGMQTIYGEKSFMTDVYMINVTVNGTVNGINLEEFCVSVVDLSTDDVVNGEKTFDEVVVNGDLMLGGYVNSLDLSESSGLYLSKTIPQHIDGYKEFSQNITLNDLMIDSGFLLDGVDINDMALIDQNAVFSVDVYFNNTLTINADIIIEDGINGVDIVELDNTAVKLNTGEQLIYDIKSFGDVTIDGDLVVNGTINAVDVTDLAAQAVSKTAGDIYVHANTNFSEPVQINGDALFMHDINGVDLHALYEDAVNLHDDQDIDGAKILVHSSGIYMNNVEVTGDVNGDFNAHDVHVGNFVKDLVMKSTDQDIYSSVVFNRSLVLNSNLIVNGFIDFVDPSEDLVLVHSNGVVTGDNTFYANITIDEDLVVVGFVDGVNVTHLNNKYASLSRPQEITGAITFQNNVTVVDDININGTLNGVDIDDIVLINGDQTIVGNKTFSDGVVIVGDLVTDEINGLNLQWLHDNMVRQFCDHNVTGEKVFQNDVYIMNDMVVLGLINGVIDIPELHNDGLKVFQDSTRMLTHVNETIRGQCELVFNLSQATAGQGMSFSHFEDFQDLYTISAAQFNSVQYDSGVVLFLTESNFPFVPRCTEGHLYMCPQEDTICWEIQNQKFPSTSSVKGYNIGERTFVVLTHSEEMISNTCVIKQNDMVTRVLDFDDASFDQNLTTSGSVDSVMFSIDGEIYLVVANGHNNSLVISNSDSDVFKYNEGINAFEEYQQLPTYGVKAVTFIDINGVYFLAFANSYDSEQATEEVDATVHAWNPSKKRFEAAESIVDGYVTVAASDVINFSIDDEVYVAYASKNIHSGNGGDINIFKYESTGFKHQQRIELTNIVDLEFFEVSGMSFILAVDSTYHIHIQQWAAASNFVHMLSWKYTGIRSVHAFKRGDALYIAAAVHVDQSDQSMSKIMKAVVKGDRSMLEFEIQN
ncbi:uncharacterized protein LOC102809469 [Saccoglossus kowalevskii]|uniref:Uncharacterized protein LOC102809469 n=1 Tax=Saccoglossus kowalevskii TaxID=10224 RepID=A0ABM0MVG8_SACKO|nr:PREDICTED: uncharacterized protein LOC102809469 [Saccoglossus kowalevskii]